LVHEPEQTKDVTGSRRRQGIRTAEPRLRAPVPSPIDGRIQLVRQNQRQGQNDDRDPCSRNQGQEERVSVVSIGWLVPASLFNLQLLSASRPSRHFV
jgi:hypothetical protein